MPQRQLEGVERAIDVGGQEAALTLEHGLQAWHIEAQDVVAGEAGQHVRPAAACGDAR
jgi:hypothetical protein